MNRKSTLSIIRVFPTLILFILILVSCENTNSTITKTIDSNVESIGKIQFEQKCKVCHGFENKTEEEMVAPPMYAVKRRYMKASKNKEEFIQLMADWVKNPTK
jgi:cytochrome c2